VINSSFLGQKIDKYCLDQAFPPEEDRQHRVDRDSHRNNGNFGNSVWFERSRFGNLSQLSSKFADFGEHDDK
jgi:hypothetical protein